jgi:CheY-like chemotaxis protein/phosphoribosyl 1,2-cyclic phosphodiesterase
LRLRFWGTRGSIATPGAGTTRFGGNTSCVEAITNSGQRIIFDCGTGVRLLGGDLMANAAKPISATILLSHTHWDHIQGFPFFAPVFVPGNMFTVCAPEGCSTSLPDSLAGQMQYTYFPVELKQLGATITYRDLAEGSYDIDGLNVSTQYLNHPAITVGYKIEADDVTVLYLCDHEPYSTELWRADAEPGRIESILHANDRRHARFMAGADVVIHDAQYTPEEYPVKKNWGHSTYDYVVQVAAAAGVRKLFLTHHDPLHDDKFIAGIEQRAREIAQLAGSRMEVFCAWEGCDEVVQVREPHRHDGAAAVAQPEAHIETCALRILIVDDDEDLRLVAASVLKKSGHIVSEASGGAEALAMIEKHKPDLVVLDLMMPQPDGIEVLRQLRSKPETATLPVVILTAHGDEGSTRLSFDLGATDFLSKPFSPPQLDARVRTCFARAASADEVARMRIEGAKA